MKKLVSLMLVLCMLCGATAFAATIDQDSVDQSTDMLLTLNLSGAYGYTVIIPSELNFEGPHALEETDAATEGHVYYKAEGTVSVTKAKIAEESLVIYTGSGEDGFVLTNGSGDTIGYRFDCSVEGGAGEVLENNEMVIPRNETGDFQLTFKTDSSTEDGFPAGEFTDTVTFTVALEGETI